MYFYIVKQHVNIHYVHACTTASSKLSYLELKRTSSTIKRTGTNSPNKLPEPSKEQVQTGSFFLNFFSLYIDELH
jgi:hypothetical protein